MKKATLAAVLALAVASIAVPAAAPATRAGEVGVTVTYKGKAEVSEKNRIWVFLFDTPDIGAGSQPIAVQSLSKSGATATFKDLQPATIYVAVAYDDKGGYDGNQAPPPPGTPIAIHMASGKPAPVTPGPKAAVSITFDETTKMGGSAPLP